MKMRIYLMLFLLVLATPLKAEQFSNDNAQAEVLEFRGLRFGQTPSDDMICVSGACLYGQQAEVIRNKTSIISNYKKSEDITHYNLIEITTPTYRFFNGKLVEVLFDIVCEPEMSEICTESIIETLNRQYGLTLIEDRSDEVISQYRSRSKIYLTRSKDIVFIHWGTIQGRWQGPVVKIFNKILMDEVRMAANPNYIPVEIKY